jgi:putative DNA primase/helicase
VTTGGKWPDGTGHAAQGSVILFGAEDDAGKVVVPRLAAAGADLSRVHVCQGTAIADDDDEPAAMILEHHIGQLRAALDEVADCRLIVFDPLPDYIAGDENNSAEVRAALVPLARLAQERNVAVLAVLHQNKKNDLTTVQRIAGSGAFAQIARVVLSIGTHPEDADKETGKRRIMLVSKNNYGQRDVGQAYEIETRANDIPGLVWQAGLVTMDADEIARRPTGGREHQDRRGEAVDALRDLLAVGEQSAATITATLQDAGLGRRQIDHASNVLNVIKTKRPHGWCWRLPASECRDRTVPQPEPEPAFAAWAPETVDQFNAT